MSTELGPMAWGSQNQVFLGEDLVQTRDYSDETARVIDEETERILREQQDRCRQTLTEYRHGLDLVARALLEHETIGGDEVERLIAVSRGDAPAAGTTDDEPGLDAVPDPDSPVSSDTPAAAEGNGAGAPAGVPTSAG